MTVHHFTAESECTLFSERNLETGWHAHPALEVIIAQEGTFSLATPAVRLSQIQMAVIKPNQVHAFEGAEAHCMFVFIEPGQHVLARIEDVLSTSVDGATAIPVASMELIRMEQLLAWSKESHTSSYDIRIRHCIDLIRGHEGGQLVTLHELAKKVCLSPSRLSHLFSQEIGVPIQRYILWTRLKQSVDYILRQQLNLTQAAHAAGFYDMAHFSRCFKEMMGVAPSKVYNNSLIVQA